MTKVKAFFKRHSKFILFKPVFFCNNIINKLNNYIEDKKARKRIANLIKVTSAQNKDRNIKVLFLVIDSNTWNKLKPLYDELSIKNNVEVKMVCMMPMPKKEDTSITYRYFKENGYDCIDARIGDGPWDVNDKNSKWFDIKSLTPDYVIYGEPYNAYFPKQYRSDVVSKYARICFASYGVTIIKNFLYIQPRNFCRDVYFRYATSEEEKNYIISQFKKSYDAGLQKIKYVGFMAFAEFYNAKNSISQSWAFSQNKFRAIWTPRWTTDEKIGGSNFFRYKDVLIDYVKKHKDIDFLFRPHPMALDNFIATGQMSKEDVENFKTVCEEESNLSLDTRKYYADTFWNSSVLVGDISSILVEYFITGKPIIFCRTLNPDQQSLKFFEKILSCCYVANSEDELLHYIDMLKSGNDYLKADREKLIVELFPYDFLSVAKKIADDIICDFYDKRY